MDSDSDSEIIRDAKVLSALCGVMALRPEKTRPYSNLHAGQEYVDDLLHSLRERKTGHKNNVLHFRDVPRETLDGAQATGQRALSVYSNSPATPQIDPAPRRRVIPRNLGQSHLIATAVSSAVEELCRFREAKQFQKTVQETAIDILYRDYETRLDTNAFVEAINVLESESKARIFTGLKADAKRDRWLEVAICTEIFPQSQAERPAAYLVNSPLCLVLESFYLRENQDKE
ncbi:uncharacterized protein V1513DRAFT_475143 [Lipomyces chichibuensis]|uniref:uncharacterized protein n=1 Tax=Lipomyces chichibuensis TaxID=1546026 RepID=UPI003343CAEC